MYSPKEQQEAGNTALPNLPLKPIWAAKRRRQLHPFFFRMGPVTLGITSVLLVGLMAVLYLSQLGQAVAANQQIQGLHTQQAVLQRQNQDLVDSLAQEQSPAYIAEQAKKQGLIPADPKVLQIIVVSHLKPIPDQNHDQYIKP
jgi:cell division protein FtsB